ncbi:hypothetical protein NUW58_g5314 [Xylaria curta]|uniref:Uncharacterized protein n=1 Tax=Xylaria curta TaxID=42375 RepID=A0ACC1P248_9PEZI|nr:hypothetical protein NUW58_g5314 [Xylaria curta]
MVGKKNVKKATKYAKQIKPIVQTIRAGYETYGLKNAVGNVDDAAETINSGATFALDVANKAMQFVPAMQVMGRSFADSARIFTCFNAIATTAGIGANIVLAYQGLKVLKLIDAHLKNIATNLDAQTALIAHKDFPQYVYDMISERVAQTSLDPDYDHWFFLWHPDNDWYPGFFHIVKRQPLPPEFCGYTNQIDTAFAFMLAARERIRKSDSHSEKNGRTTRPTKLHLLIPAYQPILVVEALRIPEEIGDFVIEGRIHSNREFVWLNLPKDQRHYVQDIGHFETPNQGWFDWAMSKIGLADVPMQLGEPRTLGTRQLLKISNEEDSHAPNDKENNEEQEAVRRATPRHHRHQRRRKKHHRGDSRSD